MDDGAENLKVSTDLINSLKAQGVTDIVLTPHFYFNNVEIDNFLQQRKNTLAELSAAAGSGVNLIPACEVYFSKAKLTDNLNKFTVKGTKYILLELPFRVAYSKNFINSIGNFINYSGLTPIIAHAERYPALQSDPEFISEFITLGCLIQMNTSSLLNNSAKRLAVKMLEKGQVHVIGTDCHNMNDRCPRYEEARLEIEKKIGREGFDIIQDNMKKILENKNIQVSKTKPIKKLFNFYI